VTTTRLPLLPLNSVLFPGLVLPLNIFERRYRALIGDLLEIPEDEPRRFGVVAIRDGREVTPTAVGLPDGTPPPEAGPAAGFGPDPIQSFYTVGCVADASTIRERETAPGKQADAGYEVLATGTTRFRLQSVDASGPYLVAEAEELPEDSGEGAGALASGVLRAFRTYQKQLAAVRERTLATGQELPEEPSVVSYLVAAATVLDIPAKQRLLQAPDTATRLAEELEMLRRETAVIGKLPSLPAVDLTQQPMGPN
jgi:uncharacterized protein